jgi:hypothetical protein
MVTSEVTWFAEVHELTANSAGVVSGSLRLKVVGPIGSTTDVTMVDPPVSGKQRQLLTLEVHNADSVSHTVFITRESAATDFRSRRVRIPSGGTLSYSQDGLWMLCDANGDELTVGSPGADGLNGADGALTVQEAEIDFGAIPKWEATFVVPVVGMTSAAKVIVCQSGRAATGLQADEAEFDSLLFSALAESGQFRLNARAIPGPVSGRFRINYQWS